MSGTKTVVFSRFFAEEKNLNDGFKVDVPRSVSVKRATRSRGKKSITITDDEAKDAEGRLNLILASLAPGMTIAPSEHCVSPSLKEPVALTKEQQFESYLGNCAPLMLYARDRYGESGVGGMTTRQVRAWLKANPQFIPAHLVDIDFHVDHIIGDNVGGHSWPLNYFLMPKAVNSWFGGWLTVEKRKYVGMPAWSAATNFQMWCSQKARSSLPFGSFDSVDDKFLSRRSR